MKSALIVSSRVPWIWVALLCATSVSALITATSGFKWVPTPKVRSAGSLRTVSSALAVIVVIFKSAVMSISFISIPWLLNLSRSSLIISLSMFSWLISFLFLLVSSKMLHASLSTTSKIPCKTDSSMMFPDARPFVFPLKIAIGLGLTSLVGI